MATRLSTPVLVAWSGGKDCAHALARLRADPQWRVAGLVTTVVAGPDVAGHDVVEQDRVASHGLRRAVLHAQADALGLPLFAVTLPAAASNAAYEVALAQALAAAREDMAVPADLATLAFGDLFLADVRAYREAQLARLGWRGVFPLWGEDTGRLARRIVAEGYRAILCCVDTTQLDAAFCGRDFDEALLGELPRSCDPCGENGEFHTCVHAGPLWSKPLSLVRGDRALHDGRFERVDLTLA